MVSYQAICKPNQLIYGTGTVAIACGWMPKERVAGILDPSQYAVIGGLVSSAGIDYLVRNLLANPQITGLILLGCTRQDKVSGSVDALSKFLRTGSCDFVGNDISQVAISTLVENLSWGRAADLEQLPIMIEALSKQPPWGGIGVRLILPPPEIKTSTAVGHLYGHRVEGRTIAETWVKIVHRIKTGGTVRPTGYDSQWQELINLTAVVTDEPDEFYLPEPNYLPCDRVFINEYIPQILEDAPYEEGVKYTYGQRLRSWFGRDQIEDVVNKLAGEVDAASAVMSLWDAGGVPHSHYQHGRVDGSSDHQHGGSPCLNHVWLRVVDGELSLTGLFRSNDMFSAWPANAFGLRALQHHIRDTIRSRSSHDLKMGPLITISQSAHIYQDCWQYADKLIAEQYGKLVKPTYSDPAGNYLIEVEPGEITVSRCLPRGGKVIATYSGSDPLKLLRAIVADAPALQPDHAGYLGIELEKAAIAVRQCVSYVQDKSS